MGVLILVELENGAVSEATLKAVQAAKTVAESFDLLVPGPEAAAQAAAKIPGAAKVLYAEAEAFTHGLAEPIADLTAAQAQGYTHIFAAATAWGKNVLARLAGLQDVMLISDVTAILDAETFERPIYAGNAIMTVKSTDALKLATIRPASFTAAPQEGGAGSIEAVSAPAPSAVSAFVSEAKETNDRPQLTSAKIVVSGGRALGSEENFALIEKLAQKLGAAVGASRAAVDAGYAPNDLQVGQTGKIVAPDLYIAVGISGAIQHLAGMKDSKIIVAINNDPEAPIFEVADFGLVADLFTALPELEAALG